MASNNKWIKYGPRAICGKYKKIKNYDQNRKDHAYYKRLEKQAEYEVEIGKFKEAEELFLKAAKERLKHTEKYFPIADGRRGHSCENHEARWHAVIGKAWQAREAYEEEKKENGENSNVYNVWLHCSWREKKPLFDEMNVKHRKRTLTDYARQLRLNRK